MKAGVDMIFFVLWMKNVERLGYEIFVASPAAQVYFVDVVVVICILARICDC